MAGPCFVVDINYESRLFHDCDKEGGETCKNCSLASKENKEFEYVFFLLNTHESCSLKPCRSYDEEYLESLRELGFKIPLLNPESADYDFFWGPNINREKEQMLNSKVTNKYKCLADSIDNKQHTSNWF